MPEEEFNKLATYCKEKLKTMHERGESLTTMMWYVVFTIGYEESMTGRQVVELFDLIPLK